MFPTTIITAKLRSDYICLMPQTNNESRLSNGFSRIKLIVPTVLGLSVVLYMFREDFTDIKDIKWSSHAVLALIAAAILVVIRDLAYVIRIKVLSMGELSWRGSVNSILLWEFSSALTPSVIGGSAFAVLILKREGMSTGRSAATVLATALLDELFYVIAVPVIVLIAGIDAFFPKELPDFWGSSGIQTLFFGGYAVVFSICLVILFALFAAPKAVPKFLGFTFNLPLLRRWNERATRWASEWDVATDNLRGAGGRVWAKATLATLISWTARFLTLNAVLYVFMKVVPNADVLARQLAMWIVLLLSPTPGSSGIAEIAMPTFIGSVVSVGRFGVIILIWRFFTYYIYLILGALIFPRWFSRTSDRSQVIEVTKN